MELAGLIWIAGLTLGIVAIVRGERVLGIWAIGICAVQVLCAALLFALGLGLFLLILPVV
jgi:CHASE2 domain-containing sensor protein